MSDFYSVTVTTRNENGKKEAQFEMRQTLLDKILRRPGKVHTFIEQPGTTIWHNKENGKRASTSWEIECLHAEEWARQTFHREK